MPDHDLAWSLQSVQKSPRLRKQLPPGYNRFLARFGKGIAGGGYLCQELGDGIDVCGGDSRGNFNRSHDRAERTEQGTFHNRRIDGYALYWQEEKLWNELRALCII